MSGVFEALGLGKYSLIVSLLRQLLITVPLAYILLNIMGIEGIWLSFVIAEAIASIQTEQRGCIARLFSRIV